MLDCAAFKPFQVLRFAYRFHGDPDEHVKLWIVALNDSREQGLICFKPTSKIQRYLDEPVLLEGAIEYRAGENTLFPEYTVIPVVPVPVPYQVLRNCDITQKVEVLGEMPEDFCQLVKRAIENNPEWNKAKKKHVLMVYGFSPNL